MNLLLYFCVPLVVTGQVLVTRSDHHGANERKSRKDVESPETSETEMYSKYEYGSQVGYKNPIDEFVVGQHGEYYRRPYTEDTGEVGKPSIYNTANGNNDHPSFIASNVYTSIRDKKNGRGTTSSQLPSPLAYGVPPEEQIAPQHHGYHQNNLQSEHVLVHPSLSPVVQKAPLVPLTSHQHVLVQDPHSGQLVQTPVYQNGLVPLYQSHAAPQLAYYGSGGGVAPQKVLSTIKTTGIPLYQQQFVGKPVAPVHQQEVLLNAYAPAYYQAPLLKTGIAPPHGYLQKGHGEQIHLTNALNAEISHPQLVKTHDSPVYETHVFKSPDTLVYQKPVLKAHPTPVLKTEPVPLYAQHHHHHQPGPLYQLPLPLMHFKSPDGTIYQAPINPLLLKYPTGQLYHQGPATAQLYQPAAAPVHFYPQVQQYQQPIHPQTATGPLLETPVLKTHNVEATIVPAIEEHVSELYHAAPVLTKTHLKQPHPTHFIGPGSALLAPRHPKVLLQKAILHKPPVLTEKAVLKAALSPAYGNPAINIQKAIYKAPLHSHFVDNGSHFGQISPAAIFSSHKAVVNSLISSDNGKHYGGKATGLLADATHIELVPSLSYGYSYSQYPTANGVYGPPLHGHHHHHK